MSTLKLLKRLEIIKNTMERLPEAISKSIGKNEALARILVHSAFDVSDSLYNFASWLGEDSFVGTMQALPDKSNVGVR